MSSCKQQEDVLGKFREKVGDFLSDDLINNDAFLMRWLIAREFDVDKAVIMLSNYIEWRKDNDIDNILKWEPAEDIKKACPYEICGVDLEGRPILIFPYARWNSWDFTDSGRREEYVKYMHQMLERCVAAIKSPATQFVILADSEGFSFRHMSRMTAIDANLEVLRGFEAHYPEMMKMAIAINCPKIFSLLYAVIKPLMSTRTREKLQVYDSNIEKWQSGLFQYISCDQLPKKYENYSYKDKRIIGDELLCESTAQEVMR